MKLLLDENLSPLTADFLKNVLGYEDLRGRLFVVTEGKTRVRRKP